MLRQSSWIGEIQRRSWTDCHTAFQQWIPRLETLERELKLFEQNIDRMLEDYFEELPSRKWEACAEAFDDYCRDDPESGEIQR